MISSARSCSMPVRFIPGFTSMNSPTRLPFHASMCSRHSTSAETLTLGNCSETSRTRRAFTEHWISNQYVRRAGLTHGRQLERGRALEVRNAVLDESPHHETKLRRLDVWTPAISIAAQQP